MNRKLPYLLILIIFVVLGALTSATSSMHREAGHQSYTLSVNGVAGPEDTLTNPPLIPVTGNTQPSFVLIIYGLIGLMTLALILALLSIANQSTTLTAKHKDLPDNTHKN